MTLPRECGAVVAEWFSGEAFDGLARTGPSLAATLTAARADSSAALLALPTLASTAPPEWRGVLWDLLTARAPRSCMEWLPRLHGIMPFYLVPAQTRTVVLARLSKLNPPAAAYLRVLLPKDIQTHVPAWLLTAVR